MTLQMFKQAYLDVLSDVKFSERSDIKNGLPVRVYSTYAKFCPITAVCYKKTGVSFDLDRTSCAARLIGLSLNLAQRIIAAADQRKGRKGSLARWFQDKTIDAIWEVVQD